VCARLSPVELDCQQIRNVAIKGSYPPVSRGAPTLKLVNPELVGTAQLLKPEWGNHDRGRCGVTKKT
jgi:hypothetical protein